MCLKVNLVLKCTLAGWRGRAWLFSLALLLPGSLAADELIFPSLVVGSQTYSNVTVTSKTPRYIIIKHAQGMASVKLGDLSREVLKELGYQVDPPEPKPSSSIFTQKVALDPRIKEMQEKTIEE